MNNFYNRVGHCLVNVYAVRVDVPVPLVFHMVLDTPLGPREYGDDGDLAVGDDWDDNSEQVSSFATADEGAVQVVAAMSADRTAGFDEHHWPRAPHLELRVRHNYTEETLGVGRFLQMLVSQEPTA
eukprot:885977-Prymnesium_polylepis.2